MTSITTTTQNNMNYNLEFTKKLFTRYRDLKSNNENNIFKGLNGKRLRIAQKKDRTDKTVHRIHPANWTNEANTHFDCLNDRWSKTSLPYSPDYQPPVKKSHSKVKATMEKVVGDLNDVVMVDDSSDSETDDDDEESHWGYGLVCPMSPEKKKSEEKVAASEEGFATEKMSVWDNPKMAEAIRDMTEKPEEENTAYKFMTEEEWNNAKWNQGEGVNLPMKIKNKYLVADGKQQFVRDSIKDVEIKLNLKFYEIPSQYKLPDEEIIIGDNWIMKEVEDRYEPHRICGTVIIGILAPEDVTVECVALPYFHIGNRLNIGIPKTSFEHRGIYEYGTLF